MLMRCPKNRQNGVLSPNFFKGAHNKIYRMFSIADEPTSRGKVSRKSAQRRKRKRVWKKLDVKYNDRSSDTQGDHKIEPLSVENPTNSPATREVSADGTSGLWRESDVMCT